MPKVSVIIPTYNRASTIKEALLSIFGQTYLDFEIIVVDDGSTDNTCQIISELGNQSGKVQYIYQDNRGRSSARNLGVSAAQGDYVAFLDSDDFFLPNKLSVQVLTLEKNFDFGMSYSTFLRMQKNRYVLENAVLSGKRMSGWIYPELLFIKNNIITVPSVMVRTRILKEVGGFDETMHTCEDLDLWRRIARRYKVLQIEQPLAAVRYNQYDPTTLTEKVKARTFYYQKAIAEDPSLKKSIQAKLFSEMYSHYGIEAINNGKVRLGFHLLIKAAENDPVEFLRSCGGYSIGVARSGIVFLLQSFLTPAKYDRVRDLYRRLTG